MAEHALGVGPVERQAGEELGRHAAAAAGVVVAARFAGAAGLRAAQLAEQLRLAPDALEAARLADVAGEELVVDRERAGVDVADRVDQADDAPGAAEVQPRQRLAVAGEVEERVAGQHLLAVAEQPVVELALLGGGRVQLVPDVGAAARRPQPGDPQLRAVAVGDRLELVELADVLAGDDDGDLGAARSRPRRGAPCAAERRVEGARAADGVVDLGGRAVERDLDVDVVGGGEPRGALAASIRLPLVENLTPTSWAIA